MTKLFAEPGIPSATRKWDTPLSVESQISSPPGVNPVPVPTVQDTRNGSPAASRSPPAGASTRMFSLLLSRLGGRIEVTSAPPDEPAPVESSYPDHPPVPAV